MEVLRTVDFCWETVSQYMDTLERRLGVNVGNLIGHSALRYYVMGDECQGREATGAELESMQAIVREAMNAGALGLSVSKNKGHTDPQGVLVPAVWAPEEEIFALGGVLRDMGTGIIQGGGGRAGLGIITAEADTLTLADRIAHHYTTGLSTVETAANNHERIVRDAIS